MKIDQLQQVLAAVFYLANRLQNQGDQVHPQLTMRQWMLLLSAAHLDEAATYSSIAQTMGCTKQNVKQLASVLFKKGYLLHTPHPTDCRAVWLRISPEGRAVMQEYYRSRDTLLLPLTQLYSEEELSALLALLNRFITYADPNRHGYEESVAFLAAAPPASAKEAASCQSK